jgi:hypothetical protein
VLTFWQTGFNIKETEMGNEIEKLAGQLAETDEQVMFRHSQELLLKNYLAAREAEDTAHEKTEKAQKALKDSLGDTRKISLLGLKVLYEYDKTLDTNLIQKEHPKEYFACLKDPELNIPAFRKAYPGLADEYSIESKKRPLKVVV